MIGEIPMRIFESEVRDRKIIAAMLDEIPIVHVAAQDGEYPYVVPLSYGYEMTDEKLLVYVHGAREGHKVDVWRKNPKVSLTFSTFCNHPNEKYKGSLHDYRSVMANGIIRPVYRGEPGGTHGHAVQALMNHNGRKPGQFSVRHYGFMAMFVVECDWAHVSAKTEVPVERPEDIPFPTPEEIRAGADKPFDYACYFNRKPYGYEALPGLLAAESPKEELCRSGETETWLAGVPGQGLRLRVNWTGAPGLDCDISAVLLNGEGQVARRYDMAFYNQRRDRYRAVYHEGDDILNRPGQEALLVDADRMPEDYREVVVLAGVYDAENRGQSLEQAGTFYLTAELAENGECLGSFRVPMEAEAGAQPAMALARLVRTEAGWNLCRAGEPYGDWRLTALMAEYGLKRWKE